MSQLPAACSSSVALPVIPSRRRGTTSSRFGEESFCAWQEALTIPAGQSRKRDESASQLVTTFPLPRLASTVCLLVVGKRRRVSRRAATSKGGLGEKSRPGRAWVVRDGYDAAPLVVRINLQENHASTI